MDDSCVHQTYSDDVIETLQSARKLIEDYDSLDLPYSPARARAALRDLRRILCNRKMTGEGMTHIDVGINHLIDGIIDDLFYDDDPSLRFQLGVRLHKAKRELDALITLMNAYYAYESE